MYYCNIWSVALMPLERLLDHVVRGMQSEVEARGESLPWYATNQDSFALIRFRAVLLTPAFRYSKNRTRTAGKLMIAFVAITCLGGLIARCVSAGIYFEASRMGAQLAVTCGGACNATIARTAQFKQWIDKAATAQTAVSAQQILESCSLLAVAIAYLAVWPICAYINHKAQVFLQHSLKKVHSAADHNDRAHKKRTPAAGLSSSPGSAQAEPSSLDSASASASKTALIERTRLLVGGALKQASHQRARILIACGVVVAAFVPRCVYSVMNSYGSVLNDFNSACKQCESCQNDHSLINTWLGLTPELAIFVTMFSEPVALSVSLWCMLTPRERYILRNGAAAVESTDEHALTVLKQGMHIDLQAVDASAVQMPAHVELSSGEWRPSS